jgi:hypothetical protein
LKKLVKVGGLNCSACSIKAVVVIFLSLVMATHTVRVFKLIRVRLKGGKEEQCVLALKGIQMPGKHSHREENNIKMGFKEYNWSLCIGLTWL